MAKKINMYKTYSGAIIIGEVDSENENEVTLSNPRTVSPQMTMQGYALALMEIVPYKLLTTKKVDSVRLNQQQIMVKIDEADIVKEIIDEYRSDISGIDIVSGLNANMLKGEQPKGGDIII